MGYATLTDVRALAAARKITATSVPNATQVAKFLEWSAAEIDGILTDNQYALPIATTATSALALLTKINAQGGWAQAEAAAPTSPKQDEAAALYAASLAALRANELVLAGAGKNSDTAMPRGPGVTTPVTWATPFVRRDMDF